MKPELIAPAGDLEKLKIAFLYGADAVYASTPKFSMRTREIGFDTESLKEGIKYAHDLGKKVYLTVNTFPHSSEVEEMKAHVLKTIELNPDALIVADPGIMEFARANTNIPIHLSTQANTTNYLSAEFWRKRGVNRIVLARELSMEDIKLIANKSKVEIETFVHGAMCMAYSGRCQISNYFLGRDPNKGACAQPCRFKYHVYGIEEDTREGERFQIYEDERGSYVLNSKDLCMIDHIPELIEAGVQSFKLEGRLKSIYYVGAVTRAYRRAIDLHFENKKEYLKRKKDLVEEVSKTSNRGFTTGFYFGKPDENTNNYETSRAKSEWGFVGLIKGYDSKTKMAEVEVKNYLPRGAELEIVTPQEIIKYDLKELYINGEAAEVAHAGYMITIPVDKKLSHNSFLRIKNDASTNV